MLESVTGSASHWRIISLIRSSYESASISDQQSDMVLYEQLGKNNPCMWMITAVKQINTLTNRTRSNPESRQRCKTPKQTVDAIIALHKHKYTKTDNKEHF
jgi:hypothetical protein